MARESWTDERLDDLKGQMIERFEQVDRRFEQVDRRFDRVDKEIGEMRGDIKTTQRLMAQGFIAISTLMITGFGIVLTGLGIMAF